jgi:cold shock CspA family protein
MEIGLIEWFDHNKGFGLIKTADNNEVFLHLSNWKDSRNIDADNKLPVVFNIGFQSNKHTAIGCKYFDENNSTDWTTLYSVNKHNFLVSAKNSNFNLLELICNSMNSDYNISLVKYFFNEGIQDLSESELFDKHNWIFRTYQNTIIDSLKKLILECIKFRIYKLSNTQILRFWKEKILSDFEPNDFIFTNNFMELGIEELKAIRNSEMRNIIIIKKVQNLSKNFNLHEFLNFDHILKLVDTEKLKIKIIKDLSQISETHYLEIIYQNIEESTKDETISIWDLKKIISEQPTFLDDKILASIKVNLEEKIIENCSFRALIDCWDEDLIDLNNDFIKVKFKEQNTNDLEYFLNCKYANTEQIDIVLEQLFKLNEYEMVLDKSKVHSAQLFEKYDKLIFNCIEEREYFAFWKLKKGKIIPENYLKTYLTHDEDNYRELDDWLQRNILSIEDAKKILFLKVQEITTITSRFDFYTLYNAIKSLLKIDKATSNYLTSLQNLFIPLILWHLKIIDELDFETLKGKFIYFNPNDQVNIFKRLFYLKHNHLIDFDLDKLDEILRADIDLYLLNEQFTNDFVLDISTHIIIECLKSYVKTDNFVFESDLILKDLRKNSGKKFKIEHYFDKCKGRLSANWDWNTEGKISKVSTESNGKIYEFFKVKFEFNQDIVDSLSELPFNKRKYYAKEKYWGVSLSCEMELFEIAAKYRFFIELPNNKHFDNNLHLVYFTRQFKNEKNILEDNIPHGIIYCEGRKANKDHGNFKKEFWWCANQECFQNCVNDHLNEEGAKDLEKDFWEEYTLLDFLRILNVNVDENNGLDRIKDGNYHKFLGHINAFNRLLERLYCDECRNLVYPKDTSHFALFRDVRFYCIEETCSKKHAEIYLNNCLYGECKTVIDSRISKRCKHGLFICHNCGTCCSEDLFKRRLANLNKVGGFIHEELMDNVAKQNGHLEKKEYYCFKCSGMMTEMNTHTYQCKGCNVEYDLHKFKWLSRKWTQTNLRRVDYPIYEDTKNDNRDDIFL